MKGALKQKKKKKLKVVSPLPPSLPPSLLLTFLASYNLSFNFPVSSSTAPFAADHTTSSLSKASAGEAARMVETSARVNWREVRAFIVVVIEGGVGLVEERRE